MKEMEVYDKSDPVSFYFVLNNRYCKGELPFYEWEEKKRKAESSPVKIGKFGMVQGDSEFYIYYYKWFFWMSEIDMTEEEFSLVYEKSIEIKKSALAKELDRIKAQAEYEGTSRIPIPEDVQVMVWNRDGGKCVKCGSAENLEFDHIIPISKGGSNTAKNIQLLCEHCNRSKGAQIGG